MLSILLAANCKTRKQVKLGQEICYIIWGHFVLAVYQKIY